MKIQNITNSDREIFDKYGKVYLVKPNEIIEIIPKGELANSFKEVKTEIPVKRRNIRNRK